MSALQSYQEFIDSKTIRTVDVGMNLDSSTLNPQLFPFQRDIVAWALRKGRAAIFADCGLGKTPMQLEWANQVPGRVLILAPLAVGPQTVREAAKFGVSGVSYTRKPDGSRITVTNYEMLEHFNLSEFDGVVLDESSILKAYDGKVRNEIITAFSKTPFASPAQLLQLQMTTWSWATTQSS